MQIKQQNSIKGHTDLEIGVWSSWLGKVSVVKVPALLVLVYKINAVTVHMPKEFRETFDNVKVYLVAWVRILKKYWYKKKEC